MKCPDCNKQLYRQKVLLGGEPDDPIEGEAWICENCGYEEEYLAEPFSFVDDEAQLE